MQKKSFIVVMFFALIILFSSGVLAQYWGYWDFEGAAEQIVEWIQQIFGPFFAVLFGSTEFLFEKILFLFIILSFSFVALKRFPMFEDHIGALWVVVLSVSVLATRFLSEAALVQNILLPYTILGVALTAAIPFIIFFFFVQSFDSGTVRKVLWIFFIVIFWGLWGSRYGELGDLSWIYFITGILALIFLFADGTIRRILIKQQMEQLGIQSRQEFEREIRRKIRDADEDLAKSIITPSQHRYIKRRLQKQLKALRKH